MSGMQQQVNVQPAPAVAGDWADANPRRSVNAGPGALVADSIGVVIGRFAWADSAGVVSSTGAGVPTGFVHREQQALITEFLAEYSNLIPAGMEVTLHDGGCVWVKNDGGVAATIGMKAYAKNVDGSVTFNATSTPPAGGTSTASTVAVNISTASGTLAANSFTGSIAGTTLTVSAVAAGTVLGAGLFLSGGSSVLGYVDAATAIESQLTGTAGGVGTYTVSVSQTVDSGTITATGGGMTIGAMTSGQFYVGQVVSGTGITSGTKILAAGTGAGGAGTYVLDTAPTPGSSITVTGAGGFLTIGGTVTGAYEVGNVINGSGITAGSTILLDANSSGSLGLTGTGGAGTYIVSAGQTVSSQVIDVYSAIETAAYAVSAGAVGELVKMRMPFN